MSTMMYWWMLMYDVLFEVEVFVADDIIVEQIIRLRFDIVCILGEEIIKSNNKLNKS